MNQKKPKVGMGTGLKDMEINRIAKARFK